MGLRKILVVEDSALLHQMYEVALFHYRREGAEILHAQDGAAALRALGEHPDTDLILLDLNMPVLDGVGFLRARRSRAGLRSIPVIVVTSRGEEATTGEALAAGASLVLYKPLRTDALHAEMEKLFGRRAGKG